MGTIPSRSWYQLRKNGRISAPHKRDHAGRIASRGDFS
jgi:hypothetical protein